MNKRLQRRRISLCVRAVLLGSASFVAAGMASAATITVDSLADTASAGDSDCTLREAIGNANSDSDTTAGDCVAGASADSIIFSVIGTVTLTSGLPYLSDVDKTTIHGDKDADGANDIIISGAGSFRPFDIAQDAEAELAHLDIVDGYGGLGGGISNLGILTVRDCTISGNTATGYGGGIFNGYDPASLTIIRATVVGNTAGYDGGGLDNNGPALIVNSTFTGNSAGSGGGAIDAWDGTLEIVHSTFSGNTATDGAGIYFNTSDAVSVTNSILADNTGGNCAGLGVFTTAGSLSWPATDTSCAGIAQADPMLGILQDNGGPTWTMLPGTGSAAIDAVACDPAFATDQRGVARPQGAQCDIGAVEATVPIIVNSLADTASAGDGDCTLREAIGNANSDSDSTAGDCVAGAGPDSIIFSVSGSITLGSNLPSISDVDKTTINGDVNADGANDITISGAGSFRPFYIAPDAKAELAHLDIVNGYGGTGGGIHNIGILTVRDSTISGNTAANYGGGIYNSSYYYTPASLTIIRTTVTGNTAESDGGGLDNNAPAVIINSTFAGNSAGSGRFGGAIDAWYSTLEIVHSTFSGNTASMGAGIYFNTSDTVSVSNSILIDNTGGNCGGTGTFTTAGNLSWPATDTSCAGITQADPMLGALQDNGGPTWTMLPDAGSAAIDAVVCDGTTSEDQRGITRPQGAQCDIGAVEVSFNDLDRIFANGFD